MPLTSTIETRCFLPQGMMGHGALGVRPDSRMPAKKAARFPRTARLLRHADFERVYKQGRRHFSASMTVFYWPRPAEAAAAMLAGAQAKPALSLSKGVPGPHLQPQGLRIGFTVGRALGGAVQRNRMKRRLREAVRMSRPTAGVAADVVINPKKSLLTADFSAVLNEVSRAFAVIEEKLSGKPSERTQAGGITNRIAASRKPEAGSRP